jgi:Bacterial dnaA protein helix-turn-helix
MYITVRNIITIVAGVTGVTAADIISNVRQRDVAHARFMVCMLAHKYTDRSLAFIGRVLNGRDHTTVMHAITRAQQLMMGDEVFAARAQRAIKHIEDQQHLSPEEMEIFHLMLEDALAKLAIGLEAMRACRQQMEGEIAILENAHQRVSAMNGHFTLPGASSQRTTGTRP